jgi:DNA-binding LacI/PurR family transcriptional regulator
MIQVNNNHKYGNVALEDVSGNEIKRVENYLLDAVKTSNPGSRLPSIRQIRKDCNVGQSTIDRAIENLRNEHVIEVKSRAGLFSTFQRPAADVKIYYFADLDSLADPRKGYFYYQIMSQLLFSLSDSERKIKLIKSPGGLTSEAVQALLKSRPCTLLTVGVREADFQFLESLRSQGYTIGHLLPNFQESVPGGMHIDDNELMRTQLEYLVNRGHKHIAYFHRVQPDIWARAENMRWTAYHHYALQYGVELRKEYIVQVDISAVDNMEKTEKAAFELTKLDTPPTALILCSDSYGRATYRGLRAGGMEPGKDIAVVGTNNMGICDSYDPSLSSAGFDMDESFERFHDMLSAMEQGAAPGSIKMVTKFFERESTTMA